MDISTPDTEEDEFIGDGIGGKGKIEIGRFKGLGGNESKAALKETTMDPQNRRLVKFTNTVEDHTGTLIKDLMGKAPEKRFKFIQKNAKFTQTLDI